MVLRNGWIWPISGGFFLKCPATYTSESRINFAHNSLSLFRIYIFFILAYRRHWLSRRVRIKEPILRNPAFLTLFCSFGHFLAKVFHFFALFVTFLALFVLKKSCFMCHKPHVMCHISHVMCHISHITCHMSHVTFHLSLTPTTTATDLHLMTPFWRLRSAVPNE